MLSILPGRSFPLGSQVYRDGVHFSVYSRNATAFDLLLFDTPEDDRPSRVLPLEQKKNRTFYYWHANITGLKSGQIYAYRAYGPNDPARGLRFDPTKVLLDPYARAVVYPKNYSRLAACQAGDNTPYALKSMVVDSTLYEWGNDLPLQRPFSQTVIYELHPAGFTKNPNSGVSPATRGTFAGMVERIPYLLDLGVTAVELMPVYAFDPEAAPLGKTNYWGYAPINFFSPNPGYSSDKSLLGPLNEFRDMVKAFHKAGLEVILDVVYNHTAEADGEGPTTCFRGLENETYYILEKDKSKYANFSGTGNTLNANHPVVRRMILDSLRYWVAEMHVDGFRFDLASILSRDEQGNPMPNPPILWDIESDPYLAGAKLIAEAWDADGLYQVGSFIGDRWKEWNGVFRDDIRSFVKGDDGSVTRLAERVQASPDLYGDEDREPERTINFVTCHDGFTLNDLVSYSSKHNEANGEKNRDGMDDNRSWNHGVEGPSDDPQIESLRNRQVKNFFAYTLLSLGTPMLAMGDEVRRTQQGNNNAYCQDNEISWFDWDLLETHADVYRFVKELIRFRLEKIVAADDDGNSLSQALKDRHITWHGVRLNLPDWRPDSHAVGMTLRTGSMGDCLCYFFFNSYWDSLTFELPALPEGMHWRRIIDTSLPSPDDISPLETASVLRLPSYCAEPRSVVVLMAS